MLFLYLSVGIGFFSILFRLASALRLGIPAIYILLVCTVFSSWYDTHEPLGDGILFVLLACVMLSWVYSAVQKIRACF